MLGSKLKTPCLYNKGFAILSHSLSPGSTGGRSVRGSRSSPTLLTPSFWKLLIYATKPSLSFLQSIGCDDFLGSDKVVDKCGVCGGDNTGCQVVSGVFKHALTSLGYHRVVEIPQGATKINITEMHKSNNYLGEFTYLLHTGTRDRRCS